MTDWKGVLARYGITYKELQAIRYQLIIAQKFKCAVCGKDCSGKQMDLDHDHVTNELRGMVCGGPYSCNKMMGVYTPRQLERAARYMRHPPTEVLLPRILKEVIR